MKNFKVNKLAFAVTATLGAAALSPSIQAVNIAEDGKGEVLLFPYYTVNGGWDTYVSVINTSDRTAIFKIRFREAFNSRDARDFNVILSPRDVWAAAITEDESGAARVQTVDNTCTAPRLPVIDDAIGLRGISFTNLDYIANGTNGADRSDTGPIDLGRTREGYIEVIEMGVALSENVQTAIDAKHVNTTVDGATVRQPRDCNAIVNRFQPGNIAQIQNTFGEPENILKGTAVLIKVDEGKAVGYNPTVLANFYNPEGDDGASDTQNIIVPPADDNPDMSDVNPATAVMHTNTAFSPAIAGTTPGDMALVATFMDAEDAVSALLMRTGVINQFNVATGALNATDWVVTFPTKNFYVDNSPQQPLTADDLNPFQYFFQNDDDGDGLSCVTVAFDFVDREEFSPDADVDLDFSPRPPGAPSDAICYEANVLTFNQTNVLQSANSSNVQVSEFGIANGFMDLTFMNNGGATSGPDQLTLTSVEGYVFRGLPAIGFAISTAENGEAQEGKVLNYGMSWDHAYRRAIFGNAVDTDPTDGIPGRGVVIS